MPVNDAPVAGHDSYAVDQGTALNVAAPGVLGNDTDADGHALTAAQVSGPAQGTLVLNADGSFTYTPNAGFSGADSFTYTASDGQGGAAQGLVTITVNPAGLALHVERIDMLLVLAGKNWKAQATVLIYDQNGQATANATVSGNWYWRGALLQTGVSGLTDALGQAVIQSSPTKPRSGDVYTFVVTGVALTGYQYDPSANKETQDSITKP